MKGPYENTDDQGKKFVNEVSENLHEMTGTKQRITSSYHCLSKKNSNVKVRYLKGALVEDMFHNLVPLMRKKPSALILHVGTNNKVSDSSKVILKKINSLISDIKLNNPERKIIISQPVRRTDNGKATLTLNNLNKLLAELDVDKIDNSNIDVSCLGKRGLHLNSIGRLIS